MWWNLGSFISHATCGCGRPKRNLWNFLAGHMDLSLPNLFDIIKLRKPAQAPITLHYIIFYASKGSSHYIIYSSNCWLLTEIARTFWFSLLQICWAPSSQTVPFVIIQSLGLSNIAPTTKFDALIVRWLWYFHIYSLHLNIVLYITLLLLLLLLLFI